MPEVVDRIDWYHLIEDALHDRAQGTNGPASERTKQVVHRPEEAETAPFAFVRQGMVTKGER